MSLSILITYLVNGLILFGLIYLSATLIKEKTLRRYYYPSLVFKLICTVSIILLYTQYYQGGDIIAFFESARLLNQLPLSEYLAEIKSSTLPSDSQRGIYFVRIVSLLIYMTKSGMWLTAVYLSLASFFGSFYFISQLNKIYPNVTLPSIISLLFFPSIVFWSSGIIKEALVFGCFLFFIGFAFKSIHSLRFKWYELPIALLSLTLLIILKYYIAAALIPCLALYYLIKIRSTVSPLKWYGSAVGIVLIVIVGLQLIHPNLNPNLFFHAMDVARNTLIENSKSEAIIHLYSGNNNVIESVINVFILLFSGFFRPTLFESFQFPNVFAGIENTLILFLFISRFFGKFSIDKKNLLNIIIVSIYITFLALFLAYASPNFGTLSRFKIYYLPFFLILILTNHPLINRYYSYGRS